MSARLHSAMLSVPPEKGEVETVVFLQCATSRGRFFTLVEASDVSVHFERASDALAFFCAYGELLDPARGSGTG